MKKTQDVAVFAVLSIIVVSLGLSAIVAKAQIDILSSNQPPIVNAGTDKSASVSVVFALSGSAVDDSGIASMTWSVSNVACNVSTTAVQQFTTTGSMASAGAQANAICSTAGTYTATLTVIDTNEAHSNDSINITITQPVGAVCGNDIIEGTEECDNTALRNMNCTSFGYSSGTLACGSDCRFNKSGCTTMTSVNSNTNATPDDTAAVCGNGVLESNEECEGTNLRGYNCSSFGYTGGTLGCTSSCRFDKNSCTNTINTVAQQMCGNSIIEGAEECDKTVPSTKSCAGFGYASGTLSCDSTCKISTSSCEKTPTCGNGILEGVEECDGTQMRNVSCSFYGFAGGTLSCQKDCRVNKSQCYTTAQATTTPKLAVCGNGIVEGAEVCDTNELRGFTCEKLGYSGGSLHCTKACFLDPYSCDIPPVATKSSSVVTEPQPVTQQPATVNTNPALPVQPTATTAPAVTNTNVAAAQPSKSQKTIVANILQQQDTAEYCATFGVTDSAQCKLFMTYDVPRECRDANIRDPKACDQFLRKKNLEKQCETEKLTSDACANLQFAKYRSQVSCGALSEDECKTVATERLIGQIVAGSDIQHALTKALDANIQGMVTTVGEVISTVQEVNQPRETVPLTTDLQKTVMIRRSDQTIDISTKIKADITIPYLIMPDDDGDGVPNDLEVYYGTDPRSADSDGDGYSDREELVNGYDPLHTGKYKMIRVLSPSEISILTGIAIEQPIAKGTTTPEFKISTISPIESGTQNILTGTAQPNSMVLIYIYSQMPLVLTVKTDSAGNWVYNLQDTLIEGKHVAYVAVTNDTGKVTEKSQPLAFFIRRAQAITVNDYLQEQITNQAAASKVSYMRYYIITGAGIIVFGLSLFFLIIAFRKKKND